MVELIVMFDSMKLDSKTFYTKIQIRWSGAVTHGCFNERIKQ